MFFAKSQKNIFALLENLDLASTQGVFGFQICFYMKKHWNVSVACAFRSHDFILFYVKTKENLSFFVTLLKPKIYQETFRCTFRNPKLLYCRKQKPPQNEWSFSFFRWRLKSLYSLCFRSYLVFLFRKPTSAAIQYDF